MDPSKVEYKDKIQYTITTAENLRLPAYVALCKAGNLPRQLSDREVDDCIIPSPFLPIPDGIVSCLTNTGCSSKVACSLSDAFLRAAHRINEGYQTTYSQSCKALAQQMPYQPSRLASRLGIIRSVFERQYRDRIIAAEQLAMDRAQTYQLAARAAHTKATFNQEFVPFLEKYFEYNAYPSAPDRATLARKSMMTPRQIEVWFQNHRNRSKKEGKPLRRLNCYPLPLELSLDSLEEKMPFFVVPEHQRKESRAKSLEVESSDDEGSQDQIKKQTPAAITFLTFGMDAPPHAFPVPYPPSCNYDPFPCKTGKHAFPVPVWRRTPATSCPVRSAVDFDDFITAFAAKLVLREASPKKQCRKSSTISEQRPWFSAIHTTAPPAPHPAFIRSSTSGSVASDLLDPLPIVSFFSRSPSPCSPVTFLVPRVQSNSPTRRKVARLPKRTPRNESLGHRGGPAASPSPSVSRTPSLSSVTSSSRHPSSSSSSSSSGPSTPTCSPGHPTKHAQLPSNFHIKGGDLVDPVSTVGYDADEQLFSNSVMVPDQAQYPQT